MLSSSPRERRLLVRCMALLLVCSAACTKKRAASADGEPDLLELRYLGSTGQVTMAELAEDLGYLAPLKLKWGGGVLGGPEAIQAVATRDIEFGNAAIGSVIKLIAAGAPITQLMASNGVDERTWGGYFVREDSPIRTARDLIGKQISVNTLGAHAEFMIREFLMRGGLSREEIGQVALVVIPPSNGEQALRQGHVQVASLSGVFRDRALSRGGIRPLFRDRDLFGSFNSVTTVVHKQLIAEHPATVRKFVEGTSRAIEWTRSVPVEQVRERMRAIITRRKRGEDASLAQYWHSAGIKTRGGILSDEDMRPWIAWLTATGDLSAAKVKELPPLFTRAFHPPEATNAAAAPAPPR